MKRREGGYGGGYGGYGGGKGQSLPPLRCRSSFTFVMSSWPVTCHKNNKKGHHIQSRLDEPRTGSIVSHAQFASLHLHKNGYCNTFSTHCELSFELQYLRASGEPHLASLPSNQRMPSSQNKRHRAAVEAVEAFPRLNQVKSSQVKRNSAIGCTAAEAAPGKLHEASAN